MPPKPNPQHPEKPTTGSPPRPKTPATDSPPRSKAVDTDSPPYHPDTPSTLNKSRTPSPPGSIPNHARPPSASHTDVRGLRVRMALKGGDFRQIGPGEDLFNCVASVISLGLDLLESEPSQVVLRTITRGMIETYSTLPAVQKIKEDYGKNIKEDCTPLVLSYFRTIRASLPHIVVSEEYGMETKNGRTNKRACPEKFDPKQAAVIELNQTLLHKLQGAYPYEPGEASGRRFRNLHVRLSLTAAHELLHVYTLFLLRQEQRHTPPHISFGPYGNARVGEVGRFWEGELLGGFVDMRVAHDGVETVALGSKHQDKYWLLTPAVIDGILKREFKDWLRPDTAQLTDREHPKGMYTELIGPVGWKNKYKDFFEGKSVKGQAEMKPEQLAKLTGPEIMKTPSYTVLGARLLEFAGKPKPNINLVK